MSGSDDLSQPLYQAIRQLTKEEKPLLIYVADAEPSQILIEMLSSLKEVSFILIQQDNIKFLCQQVKPIQAYVFEQKQLNPVDLTPFLLESVVKEVVSVVI